MDRNNFSADAVVEIVDIEAVPAEVTELQDLALVCVGGGIGNTVL